MKKILLLSFILLLLVSFSSAELIMPKGTYVRTEEHKRKLSCAGKGKKHSDETKLKMSLAHVNNINYFGHKHSPETKLKISIANKGKKRSEEAKQKISLALKGNTHLLGHKHSKEARAKMSKSRIGKIFSDETKLKMSLTQRKYWQNPEYIKTHDKCGRGNGGYVFNPFKNKEVWLKSSYEIAYATYLNKNNIEWDYENKVFVLSDGRSYRSDFYLIVANKYIEIKGWWTDIAKEKFDMFKQEYPTIEIDVLMKDDLKQLGVLA